MVNVVMGSVPVPGHFGPVRTVAADLVRRGHKVTVISGSKYRAAVEEIGAFFVSLSGAANFDIRELVSELDRQGIPEGLPRFEAELTAMCVESLPAQFLVLQEVLAGSDAGPAVVVSETAFWGAHPFLLGAAAPEVKGYVTLGVLPYAQSSIDTAPFGMCLPPDSSEEGRARNREANSFIQTHALASMQAKYEHALRKLGVDAEVPFALDAAPLLMDRYLELSIEELSYPRSDTPDSVRFVGPLPALEARGDLPAWWGEVLDAEKVVVVSQGTLANQDFSELIEPTLQALADRPVLVVAVTGRQVTLPKVPANARVAGFIPFGSLLPHADVLVSNGGFGSVQQALTYGVPLVLAGAKEDKPESNTRLASTGAAVNLATGAPTPEAISEAVESVLTRDDYRNHARRLAAAYARTDALGEIARTVTELGSR